MMQKKKGYALDESLYIIEITIKWKSCQFYNAVKTWKGKLCTKIEINGNQGKPTPFFRKKVTN